MHITKTIMTILRRRLSELLECPGRLSQSGSLHYCGGLVPTPMVRLIFIEPQVLLAFSVFLSPLSCLCAAVSNIFLL